MNESFKASHNKNEQLSLTPEQIQESVERAQALYSKILMFNGATIFGAEAIPTKHKLDELSFELGATLARVPAEQRSEHKLPHHPADKKVEVAPTPLPASPDYPLSYTPRPSEDGAHVDSEQR